MQAQQNPGAAVAAPAHRVLADDGDADEMADDAKADAHATPSFAGGPAVYRVAGLAHVPVGEPVGDLEQDSHGDHGRRMAFVANVGLNPDQHV